MRVGRSSRELKIDLETLQDIGDNIEILVIPYQAVIALDGYQTDVFGARHQHSQTATVEDRTSFFRH